LSTSDADHEAVRAMRIDLATYEDALQKVLAQIRAGDVTTPQGANEVLTVHKDAIRRLEDTAFEFATRHSKAMATIDKQVSEATSHSVWIMVTVILIALGFSIIVGFLITRSITVPLKQAVEAAERVSEGDLSVSIESGAKDEAGQLLSA